MEADSNQAAKDMIRELERQLHQKEAEIAMLREITTLIGGETNLQKVFSLVAECARDLIHAETVTIPILAHDQASYVYRAAAGHHADELINASLPIEIGICGWVLRHRTPWWRGVLESLSENERNQWEKEAGTVILVPLGGKRQFLGGIAGINKAGGGEFNKRDLDRLTLFAGQVGVAIENVMFVDELARARQRAEAFKEELETTNQQLSRTNEELQHLAVHDPLTRLPNRTLILDRLQQAILTAKRNHRCMALIMIDLDHFKEVNDTLGHTIGDQLLINIGKRFQSKLRKPDTLGRLGGDEFAVVLPEATQDDAIVVAGKLQTALADPVNVDHSSFSIGASLGIAIYPEHGADPSSLLKGADVAMYMAKRNRDEVAIYDREQDTHKPDRLELLRDLRDERLAVQVGELLGRHDLEASLLGLELTESAIMNDPEQSLGILTELQNMGVQLSIDDFGTGYSSLSYLKRLPVAELKIDRSFVHDIIADNDNAMIARSTIELAHTLGLATVAEGVETMDTLDVLQGMQCDTAQGYLISRPLPEQEFLDFLASSEWAKHTRSRNRAEHL